METIHFNDHFFGTKNWEFSEKDMQAQKIISKLQESARKEMPPGIYSSFVMTHYEQMRKHKLYDLMKTIPKGVLHHCHIDCCEDKQYYKRFIINDPIIYLTQDLQEFRIGTVKQAQQEKWVSMQQLRKKFSTQDQMVDFISNITMFNVEDNRKVAAKQTQFWPLFTKKIISFFTILFSLNHFKTYMIYICQKFIHNGYDRLEFRSMLEELTQHDQEGSVVKKHPQKKYMDVLDQVQEQLRVKYPNFSLRVIFFGLKMFSPEQNQQIFTKICELNWSKTIGFDLVQEQDAFGSQKPYDDVVTKVLAKYPHLNYKKVYHAGQTKDPLNNNIQIAVKSGSVRIGHGINIIQRLQYLPQCKNICFQINHISNILTGLRDDTRITSAPVLMGLGHPFTINPDDPGKFGYEDTTVDYFSSIISFNWSLRELKLLAIHSINHAICSEEEKIKLFQSFKSRWNLWVQNVLSSNQ